MRASPDTIDRKTATGGAGGSHLDRRATAPGRRRRHHSTGLPAPPAGDSTAGDPIEPAGPVEPAEPAEPVKSVDWPFLGRDDELRHLHGLVTGTRRSAVVLAGPMGVGKTRLALETLALAEQDGLVTMRVSATRAAAALPLGAFAQLTVPDDRPRAAVDHTWLLRRCMASLAQRAGGGRLVVLVDDAHQLDDVSATLVYQLATTGKAFVLATVRTGERAPDPVLALWKEDVAERVELGGLEDGTIAELLAAAVGGSVEHDTAASLTARAQGNVLFLRELVTGAMHDGTLAVDGDRWRLRGQLSPSNRLIELVETRLAGLDPPGRSLLELVSIGEPLGDAELRTLADPLLAEILERRGFLSSRMNERRLEVRLAHPIYGEVVRAGLSALRSRAIARALAEAVEATGARRREDTLRVACWRLEGGGGRPEILLAGATEARWHYDYVLAERLARAALDAGAGFDAALLAAHLAGLQGRTTEAERELAELADRAADDTQRGLVALARTDNSVTWTGADESGILDQAEATISDPRWRDELQARRLELILQGEGPKAAAEAAKPLLRRAQGEALVFACISGGYALTRLGHLDEALDVAKRGRDVQLASPTTLAWYTWWHEVTRCRALGHAGQLDEAEEIATVNYRKALADGSAEAQAVFALMPCFIAPERGRVQTAARLAMEAAAINQELNRPTLVGICYIYCAFALAFGGYARQAAETLAALDALDLPTPRHHAVDLLRARGWTAASAGNLPEARRLLRQAADLGEGIGDHVGEAAALHGLARFGRAAEVLDRLTALASHIDGDLAPARAAHVAALADGDAEALEAASDRFETMGADLLAAEAAADASVARQRAGDLHAAALDRRRATGLAERCEGASTPALQAIEARAMLTAAEREAALLAAAGHANREIADDLYLSVRTVENRLQRVYEKLGVSGRTDLAELLDQGARPLV